MVGLLVPKRPHWFDRFSAAQGQAALHADSASVCIGHFRKRRIQKPQDVDGLLGRIHDFETTFWALLQK